MRVAIVGAGAMGSLLAGLLQISPKRNKNDEIWLIGSSSTDDHFAAISEKGLQFEVRPNVAEVLPTEILEQLQKPVFGINSTQNPDKAYPCDLAIVLVKSYRTELAAHQISKLLAHGGLVLSLQNGAGNDEILTETISVEDVKVTQGTTLLGAGLQSAGVVVIGGLGKTSIGTKYTLNSNQLHILEWLKEILAGTGAPVTITQDVLSLVWAKLVVNCAVNPVAAMLDITNGQLLEYEETRRLMTEIALEVALVAKASGINLPFAVEEAPARAQQAAHINAANICSMVQDLRKGRQTEIEAINGAVIRQAEKLGIQVPVNRTLTELIRVREKRI